MNLIVFAAYIAACFAAKLDRSYLPPESANTAGGTAEFLQTPFNRASIERIPAGGYVNENQGVVIDASTGTRNTGPSGLGGPRISYGSTNSKVGDAAFKDTTKEIIQSSGTLPNVAGFRQPLNQVVSGMGNNYQPGLNSPLLVQERFQASRDRGSNIVRYQNDIGTKDFNYVFETDNGISAGGNGIATNGVRTQGGFSYTGDDGQVYSVSYVADEGGYRPMGAHLPTPPPIPLEILKSLEQNAKDEAAGIQDDGSYDAQKYNNVDNTKAINENDRFNDRHSNRYDNGATFNNAMTSPINQKDNSQNFINPNFNAQNKDLQNPSRNHEPINQFDSFKYNNRDKTMSTSNILSHNQFDSPSSNFGLSNGIASSFSTSNIQKIDSSPISNNKPFAFTENNQQPLSIPLSQQNLQDQKENGNSLFGRPSSYDAPITGTIQAQQPSNSEAGNLLGSNKFEARPTLPDKISVFNAGAFNNQDTSSHSTLDNNKHAGSSLSVPFDSSLSHSSTISENSANQHSQQFSAQSQYSSSANKLFNHNTNVNQNDMNKISYASTSQQKIENHLQSNTLFSQRQESLAGQKQNYYQQNPIASSVNQNNNNNNYVSTTSRPNSFNQYTQGLTNNNYYNQPIITSSPISTFPPIVSSPINVSGSSQQSSQFIDTRYPKPPVITPSKTLSTPKEDSPQAGQEASNGITQASISPFPSVVSTSSQFNKPFSTFESSKLQNNNENALDSNLQKINQQSAFSGSTSGTSVNSNQYQSEVYEYQKPVQSLPSTTYRPSFPNQFSSGFNQQTGANVQSTQQNNKQFQNQFQQPTLQSTIPQTQSGFSEISTQSNTITNRNKTLDENKIESINRPQNNNLFRPQLLPSRPPLSLQSACCSDSTNLNKKDSDIANNRHNMNVVHNVFGDKTGSLGSHGFISQNDVKGTHTSQAYDQTGYHY